jgi:transglutaminase-like putative cysteine protease
MYLGDRWWTLDARHNTPRIGRVLMATGRDATDCAFTTSFGHTSLAKFVVVTERSKRDLTSRGTTRNTCGYPVVRPPPPLLTIDIAVS